MSTTKTDLKSDKNEPESNRYFDSKNGTFKFVRQNLLRTLIVVTNIAATNPYQCLLFVIMCSFFTIGIGFNTKFHLEVNPDSLYTPHYSRYRDHRSWVENAGYPKTPRPLRFLIHANGDNVLGKEGVRLVFAAIKTVQETSGYADICSEADYVDPNSDLTSCKIQSVASFWNDTIEVFEKQVQSDDDAIIAMSATHFPDGAPVNIPTILSYARRNFFESWKLFSAKSYLLTFELPSTSSAQAFEKRVVDNALKFQARWEESSSHDQPVVTNSTTDSSRRKKNPLKVEVLAERSLQDESTRAIERDMPLIPAVFVAMVSFTCLVFRKHDRVKSRSLLGFGAVACILLSITTSYGLLFIIGVPISLLSQLLPFVIFGIGLDDTFIIYGAYNRSDQAKDPAERVSDAIEEVGLSLIMTTSTTSVAFGLGCLSVIPSVKWMGYYAFTCVVIDFLYQITFFIAILVIDERRVQANRIDCCICFFGNFESENETDDSSDEDTEKGSSADSDENPDEENQLSQQSHCATGSCGCNNSNNITKSARKREDRQESIVEKFMGWYADHLLRPWVKVMVLIAFTLFFSMCAYGSTLLTQEFKISAVVPNDSYALRFFTTFDEYGTRSWYAPGAYFRFIDQSDGDVHEQMEQYVNDLVDSVDAIEAQPQHFWLRDFKTFVQSSSSVRNLPFNEQLDEFLNVPANKQLYGGDIIRNANSGDIISSRCILYMNNINMDVVEEQIRALKEQASVSGRQSINKAGAEWSFFTYDYNYYVWEFLAATERELMETTITGIVAVSVVSFMFMPHWSAAFFIFPLISVLYMNLLGVMHFSGLHVNAVSYLSLVMSTGLLVDFIMHYLLCYYESKELTRDKKVKDALKSMGASILLGGFSTFLGIIPLAFSTSELLGTVYIAFLAMVVLGCSHGLILLPVLLSYLGHTGENSTTALPIRIRSQSDFPRSNDDTN